MSIKLEHNFEEKLQEAKPNFLNNITIHHSTPGVGALGDIRTEYPSQTIPPINTDIRFSTILPSFKLSENIGLASIDHTKLPKNFNWRHNAGKKTDLISKPGNQLLCGSCWAISTAGIISDNHVISGTVDWYPNLSTTWSLSCYPQLQCKGGNPATLFQDIARDGIVSDHCVDYSWCVNNKSCNGKSTLHFKEGEKTDLSSLLPSCGCYFPSSKHYLYSIEKPEVVSLGVGGLNEDNFTNTIKKHIYHYGPVQGGFIVFKNFMHGVFSKINGGVYLENAVYDNGSLHFDSKQTSPENYIGAHAIAIIGWGVENNVIIDNKGTKKDIPYWYCRNSWTEKWGDNGYFKMAMYPYNKISQFDKIVTIETPQGTMKAGGIVMIKALKSPELKSTKQLKSRFNITKIHDDLYYKQDPDTAKKLDLSKYKNSILKTTALIIGFCAILLLIYFFIRFIQEKIGNRKGYRGREGVYSFMTQ